jgi:hypothetical protein
MSDVHEQRDTTEVLDTSADPAVVDSPSTRPAEEKPAARGRLARLGDLVLALMSDRSRRVALASTGLACLAAWMAWWPGLLQPDAQQTVIQANLKLWIDWWTPVGAMVLHRLNEMEIGFGPIYAAAVASVVAGIYLCLRAVFVRGTAGLMTLAICAVPPMYAQLSTLSRDTFWLGLSLMSFGLLGKALRPGERRRRARLFVALSLLCAIVAFLCRQNGLAVVFAVVFVLALHALRGAGARDAGRRLAGVVQRSVPRVGVAAAAAALAAILVFGGTRVFYSAASVRAVHPERVTYVYDLASISVLSGRSHFPRAAGRLPSSRTTPAQFDLATLKRRFDYRNVVFVYPDNWAGDIAHADDLLAARENPLLRDAWLEAIWEEPFAYLWTRFRLTLSQLGVIGRPQDAYFEAFDPSTFRDPIITGPNFGHPIEFSNGYRVATDYLAPFVGADPFIPLDIAGIYLLLATLLAVVALRRLKAAWAIVLVMIAAVWLNLFGLFFTAMASGARYMAIAIPVALILVCFVFAPAFLRHSRLRRVLNPEVGGRR